ncbi:3-hydroxyacyl-CoA dehydrogenase NAD-binding domain-containing protein [Amphritea sp. HPY]|uniref:3-hydroxyacyl-CoA dehydrogenase NAD-binding domain-containing protein n=1 Tax=Amphritea sp. HPY TaxID=3421652 RepID=UPI003D7D1171
MTEQVRYELRGNIAIITLNNPPVNSLGLTLRSSIQAEYQQALADEKVEAIILTSPALFSAGADITEFGTDLPWQEPSLPQLCNMIDESAKLTVAAINKIALGGGLELALACDYRIASPSTKLGLPEVNLGLLPGAGGTQRLPRLTTPEIALQMITSGKPITAQQAGQSGLVDQVVEAKGDLLGAAIRYTRSLIADQEQLRPCAGMTVDTTDLSENFFTEFRASIARKSRGYFAPEQCIQAVESACSLPLAEGLEKEHELFNACMDTPQARAQQHLFFAEREATRIPGVDPDTVPRSINKVAVIGAGTMGGGIAMNFVNAGIPVTLLEVREESLQRGLDLVRKNYEISAQKGRISSEQVEQRMELLQGTLNYDDLADVDLVIEAVFESMEIKHQVFKKLDEVCKPGAILATNTSTLDINEIASITQRPQDVIGLHFFSPANVMRLLEIVRGDSTAADVIVTTLKMARTIGKVPVVVGVCFGFVGNRMLEPYAREAHRLVLEGASPAQIDGVMNQFGLAMGVLSMYDLAGIDVGYLIRNTRRDAIAHDPSYNKIADKLYELGRYGQKTGRGFYIYQGRDKQEDDEVVQLAAQLASELGIERRDISDQEIFERCIYSLVNEGAEILSEGIAYRSGDCDIVWVNGYGFPAWRGGPMQFADETGLDKVLAGIQKYQKQLGSYGEMWFKPSPLLVDLVSRGNTFATCQLKPSQPEHS